MCLCVELNTVFDYAEKINVYQQGVITSYSPEQKEYEEILLCWKEMTDGAHEMPAYGVSLNRETLKALNSGIWAEFVFDKKYEYNGMAFEKLLINVDKNFYGFNLIRYTSESGYDGRCFYYDLSGKTMDDFYEKLLKL